MAKMKRHAPQIDFATCLFYIVIGFTAATALLLVFYAVLRMNSDLFTLIHHTFSNPAYLISYLVITLITAGVFGANTALLVYRWQVYGSPLRTTDSGSSIGAVIGVFASACPICGSTILSLIGIAGGLSSFPFQGLELKAASLGIMLISLWLLLKDMNTACNDKNCPLPKNQKMSTQSHPVLFGTVMSFVALLLIAWKMMQTDPQIQPSYQVNNQNKVSCTAPKS